jgi:uroporphyrin-III C-methyltransferase
MNDPTDLPRLAEPPPAPAPPPLQAAAAPRARRVLVGLALLVGVLALALSVLLWQRLAKTEEALARRSIDTAAEAAAARALAAQAEALTQDLQARLGVAEVRLSEVSLQRSQLEELMLSVSRSRDDSLVQDLESTVRLAVQQAELTGSVQPLISALQSADQRIQRAAQPRLNPVQRAIARDIERIREAALLDVPSLAGRLDELARGVDGWTLRNAANTQAPQAGAAPPTSPPAAAALPPDAEAASGWRESWAHWQARWRAASARWWQTLQAASADLVRVSRIDRPEAALLAPQEAFFLRENLKLTLLNARLGLLSRQFSTARADLRQALDLLERYFQAEAAPTALARAALLQLQDDLRQPALPRPDETLTALAAAAAGR